MNFGKRKVHYIQMFKLTLDAGAHMRKINSHMAHKSLEFASSMRSIAVFEVLWKSFLHGICGEEVCQNLCNCNFINIGWLVESARSLGSLPSIRARVVCIISGKYNRPAYFAKFRIRNVSTIVRTVKKRKKKQTKVFTTIDLIWYS